MPLSIHIECPNGSGLNQFQHDFQSQVSGVFGPSGCGKTTLLETLAGMRRPPMSKGKISFGDETWLDLERGIFLPPEKRHVGYVPQHHLLFPHWKVKQNLLAGQRRAEREGHDWKTTLAQVIDSLQLEPLLERFPEQLSGGERQRVALGRALCSGAQLLLLDEPLASLDQKLRYRIIPFLQRVRETFNIPMLIVSHQPTEIIALCQEVVILDKGRLIDHGPPTDVFLKADIYSAINQSEGFENVITATVASHSETLTHLKFGQAANSPEILITRTDIEAGESVQLRLHAHEIMIARQPVGQISARNCLPARIQKINTLPIGANVLACRCVGAEADIAVELTADAVSSLSLKTGDVVYLIVKSSSFRVCR